jgi:hypothetical protein
MMRRLPLLLFLFLGFAATALAQVEPLWQRTAPLNVPAWFGANTERGLAYGEFDGNARVLVASRSETPNVIRVLDAETGEDAGTLSSVGVEGGYLGVFALSDVGVSEDGVVFASNLVLNADGSTPFRVFRWDNEADDPVRVINFSGASDYRLGDRITVTGSVDDNTVAIWAPVANQNRIVRFTTEDNGETFSHEVITLAGIDATGIFPTVTPAADGSGDFYYNATGIHPRRHAADGSHVATLTSIPVATNTLFSFEVDGQAYLAVNDGAVDGPKTFSIWTVNGASARRLVRTPAFGSEDNVFGGGDLHVEVEQDGTFVLYGLQVNGGVAAFRIDPAGIFEGTFYVGTEGTGPGGADPDFASLAEAFEAVNSRTASGAVALMITSDLDERDGFLAIRGRTFTEARPLTIKPAPEATPTIRVRAATTEEVGAEAGRTGLLIDNTSWVTIDGSNTAGGTSRDLMILVDDAELARAITVIRDAQHVTIQNLRLHIAAANRPASVGVYVRRDNDATVVPENMRIVNNEVGSEEEPFFQAVALFGTAGLAVQADVLRNDLYASQRGITTFDVRGSRYEGNRIWVLGTQATTSWSAGVYVALAEDMHIAGNEVLGFTTNTSTEAPQSNAGFLLNNNRGDIWLYNNTVAVPEFSNRGSSVGSAFHGFGVNNALGTGHHHIWHNTVRIGGSTETGRTAGLGFDVAGTTQNFTLQNNIFVNETDAENAYAIHWPLPALDLLTSSHNNLYVAASAGAVATIGGVRHQALLDLQLATGLEEGSVSKPVEFVSETDLRLAGDSVSDPDLVGVALAEVTVDIDGRPRDPSASFMGAFQGELGVSVDDPFAVPQAFELHPNYPNPFSRTTAISYTLPAAGQVSVQVYDAAGRLVRQLVDEHQGPGRQEVRFDADDLASGVYIYRVRYEQEVKTLRMTLVR